MRSQKRMRMSLTSNSRRAGVNEVTTARNPDADDEPAAEDPAPVPPIEGICVRGAGYFPSWEGSGVGSGEVPGSLRTCSPSINPPPAPPEEGSDPADQTVRFPSWEA